MSVSIFPEYFLEIGLLVVGGIIPAIVIWVTQKTKCLTKVDKRTFRQSKAMILLANKLDDVLKINHSELSGHFKRDMENALTDEKGNL